MHFTLTQEQQLLRDTLTRYLRDSYDHETRRKRAKAGPDHQLWRDLAERLGVLGAALPESAGGLGGGPVETMIVAEALGEALVPEPFIETVVIAGGILRRVPGDPAAALLARIASGEARVTPAFGEANSRYALHAVATTARRDGDGWVLEGEKVVVAGAPDAEALIVSARTGGAERDASGVSLFLVPADAAGGSRHDYTLLDDRRAADVTLAGVRVGADALLGEQGQALPLIEQVTDEGVAALAAEAVGVLRRLLDDTVAYTKQRKQFGQPLSQFQVLQHRMADMYMALEETISAAYLATLKLDAPTAERARACSAAKTTIARTARYVGQQAVQLHGGMGMTEELAIGHYFKRATVIESQFGSGDYHTARYAGLSRAA